MFTLSASELPDTICLFPLSGALLLPRARLPLQIFEPRYLQMFEDSLKTPHRLIGLVQPLTAADDDRIYGVGCVGRVTQFSEIDSERYMVTLTGVSRFRITEEIKGFSPYRNARVDWHEFEGDVGQAEVDVKFDRNSFLAGLKKYLDAQDLRTDWDGLKDAETELLINSISMVCPFDPEEKQALLEASSLRSRREILTTLIEFSLRGGANEEILQ